MQAIRSALEEEYDVVTATDGQQALDLINGMEHPEDIHLIISDQKMPHMTGVDFLTATVDILPKTIRVILTPYTEIDNIISVINDGRINRYVLKPISHQPILSIAWRMKKPSPAGTITGVSVGSPAIFAFLALVWFRLSTPLSIPARDDPHQSLGGRAIFLNVPIEKEKRNSGPGGSLSYSQQRNTV